MGVITRWLYFKLLGLSALFATVAYWWQMPGLAGSHGLAPVSRTLFFWGDKVPFLQAPTLVWLSSSDLMLQLLCGGAALGSLLVFLMIAPRYSLIFTWVCWLSLVTVGAPFLQFQWDVLLLEALLLSVPYAPAGVYRPLAKQLDAPYWARALIFVIAFKVTFQSGLVKVLSGDPSWRDFTALTFHWWSQPLPTWSSYLAWLMPLWVQKSLCAVMFALELFAPLLVFGPRPLRIAAAFGIIALQAGLGLGGNYSFFNLLTAALCIPLLDDALLRRFVNRLPTFTPPSSNQPRYAGNAVLAVSIALSIGVFLPRVGVAPPFGALFRLIDPFNTINGYGAFAVMTKNRAEIIVEGTVDGTTWKAFDFRWKPGRLDARPQFVAPWQPRLDWQMWFASLGECVNNPWLLELQRQLMLGNPTVLGLLDGDPFAGTPPIRMRTRSYEYRFAPRAEKGVWWTANFVGPYCPEVVLDANGTLQRAAP